MKLERYTPENVIPLDVAKVNIPHRDLYIVDKINDILKQAEKMGVSIRFIIIGQKQYDLLLEESIHTPVIYKFVRLKVSPYFNGIIAYPVELSCDKEFIIG